MKQKLLAFFMVGVMLIGSALAQDRQLSGKVTSQADALGLPGVTVQVSGTSIGTQTGADGTYSLSVPASAKSLEFSFIGFEKQTITIGTGPTINVSLVTDATQLGEVIVTALGIQRKKNELTYAAQEVRSEEITRTRDNNFVNALSGKVAGLEIKQSGSMGGSTNVVMRGPKSMTGNNQALFVVDGAPISNANTNTTDQTTGRGGYDYGNAVADINPDDIASMTVLKGAAASALYGSRAANGVIIITTKKGRKNSMNVTVNSGLTVGSIDKTTFAEYQDEYGAGYINGYTYSLSGNDPDLSYGSPDGNFWYRPTSFSTSPVEMTPFTEDASYGAAFDPNRLVYQWDSFDPNSPNYGKATPWVAAQNGPVTFYKTGINATQSITLDGGGDNTTFKAGYTRNDETGVLPNSKIIKNIFNLGGSYDIASNLKVSGSANFAKIDGLGRYGTGYDGNNPNQQFRQWWQTNVDIKEQEIAYNRLEQNITWNWANQNALGPIYSNNPYFSRYQNLQNDTRNRYFGNINLSWQPLEWLNIIGRITHDGFDQLQEERWAQGGADVPAYRRRNQTFGETNFDLMANFTKEINEDLTIGGLLGSNIRRSNLTSISAITNGGLAFPGLYSLSNSLNPVSPPAERYERVGVDGIFAAANIGYKSTYFLDATIRRDQSTTLPIDNNVYWYPSIAGGFIFSNLFEESPFYGKLRLNYAQVGNDATPLSLMDTYTINNLFGDEQRTSLPSTQQNSALRPERTNSVEAGLEMTFLNSRAGFDVSLYKTETFDQIMDVEVSATTGYARKWVNAGTIQNKGVEVQLWGTPVKTENFSWNINMNFSKYKSLVTELYGENTNLQLAAMQGGLSLNATLDEEMGTLKGRGYVYDEATGEKVVGTNGYYLKSAPNTVIGNINPDWLAGISNTLKYKEFSLNFLIDIRHGGDVFSLDQYYGQATGLYPETAGLNDLGNSSRLPIVDGGGVVLPGVKEDGSPNDIRVENYDASTTPYGYANNPTAVGIFDASSVKLRELALTYAIPAEWLKGAKAFKGIDVSLIGRNLWIIHKNLPYADPEGGLSSGNIQGYQSGVYPAVRSVGFNLRFKF